MTTETYIEKGVTIHIITPDESDLASAELKEQRRNICSSCNKYNTEENSCNTCGCIVDTLMTFSTSKCPDSKW